MPVQHEQRIMGHNRRSGKRITTRVCACLYEYTYFIHIYIYTYTYTYKHIHIHTHINIYIHLYTYTYIYIHIHIRIHIHMQTCVAIVIGGALGSLQEISTSLVGSSLQSTHLGHAYPCARELCERSVIVVLLHLRQSCACKVWAVHFDVHLYRHCHPVHCVHPFGRTSMHPSIHRVRLAP
jgi:hypothetical protein